MSSGLGYEPGAMGWVVPGVTTIQEQLDEERRWFDRASADYPTAYMARPAREMLPAIKEKWEAFQLSKGRFAGSVDLTLIDEFVFKKSFTFLPQGIGSCVWSNTFRRWVERMCVEICLMGDPEEFIGTTQFGSTSIAPFCVSYGFARQRANMRGGDGLYCKPMSESLLKDGVVLCSTPKLKELMQGAGAIRETDWPEPQSNALYRRIGDWAWNDALRPYAACRLLESVDIRTMDACLESIKAYKPMFMCSGIAIRKVGTHQDGFDIHARNPGDSWAHNMGIAGLRVASDGKQFIRICNTSWLQGGSTDVEKYIYNVPVDEVAGWFRSNRVDVSNIGDIDGIQSLPTMI